VPNPRGRYRDGPPVIPVSLPRPVSAEPRHFTWLCLAICVLAAAHLVAKVHGWSQTVLPAVLAAQDRQVTVTVGAAVFRLPESYIVAEPQRRLSRQPNSSFERLRLAVPWQSLGSGSAGSLGPEGGAVLIELESNPGRESLRARMDPFYRRLARGGDIAGPDGLRILSLSPRGTPADDLIAFDPSVRNGFIARCRRDASSAVPFCHRAVAGAGLDVRYRFDRALLADWRRIDDAVARRIESLRVR
jgi:hypothetical protein